MHLGSWEIDDVLTFSANTHNVNNGSAADADSAPSYRVYEDNTGTPILTGTMTLHDSANTTGFYLAQITLSTANGFERGKTYTIYMEATVSSKSGTASHQFQIGAAVDVQDINATLKAGAPIGDPAAQLRDVMLSTITGTVQTNGGNTDTTFQVDTTLGAKAADYFGDTTNGGNVLCFIAGTTNEFQARRVTAFNTTTDFITVESAFDGTPTSGDNFIIIGRIEAP